MLLTTEDLIAHLTPTALAEAIASLEQFGNLDSREQATVALLREVLEANCGPEEAAALIAAAR